MQKEPPKNANSKDEPLTRRPSMSNLNGPSSADASAVNQVIIENTGSVSRSASPTRRKILNDPDGGLRFDATGRIVEDVEEDSPYPSEQERKIKEIEKYKRDLIKRKKDAEEKQREMKSVITKIMKKSPILDPNEQMGIKTYVIGDKKVQKDISADESLREIDGVEQKAPSATVGTPRFSSFSDRILAALFGLK